MRICDHFACAVINALFMPHIVTVTPAPARCGSEPLTFKGLRRANSSPCLTNLRAITAPIRGPGGLGFDSLDSVQPVARQRDLCALSRSQQRTGGT